MSRTTTKTPSPEQDPRVIPEPSTDQAENTPQDPNQEDDGNQDPVTDTGDGQELEEQHQPATPEEEPVTSVHREAARYRTRLREVEQERDLLREQVTALHKREAESLASEILAQPGDMWLLGVGPGQLLDAGGELDPNLVHAAARALVADRPGLAAPDRSHNFGPGSQQRRSTPANRSPFSEAFVPNR